MTLFAQLLVNGIIIGSYYALLGVSWGIIFNTTKVFHFAHGFVFTIAAYAAVMSVMWGHAPIALGFISAILAAVLLGCLIERFIYHPLRSRGASQLIIFIAAMGTMIFGENIMHIGFGPDARELVGIPERSISLGPVAFTTLEVAIVLISWFVIGVILWFLNHTKLGTAIRAVSANPELAEVVGINSERIYLLAFAIGSACAGIAAVLHTMHTVATPHMGIPAVLMAFIAVFVGGVGNTAGAALGGVIIGLAENLGMLVLPAQWKILFAFLILFIVVIFRPRGILGAYER